MRFEPGQAVWVGWTPESRTFPHSRPYLCSVGTIKAGPFPAGAPCEGSRGYFMSSTWYDVVIDGQEFQAVEHLLTPFDDPGETTEVENEQALPA